ncbi:cohesin domain-containing protein, partial [Saprospiraceae bacterium]|nr:cohesin domain-containing protein [Saprospiraceae bacterium]
FSFVACLNLSGQTESVDITSPTVTEYCAEQQTEITFVGNAQDAEGNTVSSSLLQWNWAGPNGFSSTQAQPTLTLDDVLFDGDYFVTVSYPNGATATSMIALVVEATIELSCPETVIVTPDTDDINCIRTLNFVGLDVDAINCPPANNPATDFEFEFSFTTMSGMTIAADAGIESADLMVGIGIGSDLVFEDLPFGFHELRFDVTDPSDANAIVAQCLIEVQVLESINNLACNDLVNVTLTDECEAILTPSMILEGDYCFDSFELDVELVSDPSVTFSGVSQVTIDQLGLYNVVVTGQSGLSCWGQVLAEDKSLPDIDCDEVSVFCTEFDDAAPGSIIRGFDRGLAFDRIVPFTGSGSLTIPFDLDAISGQITNIVLNLEAELPNVSDLEVSLVSPSGTTLDLLDLDEFTEPCDGTNINVCLSDDGVLDYVMFGSPIVCRETLNAFIGSFKPENAFSTLYTEDAAFGASTTWNLVFTNNSTTDPINIVEADLQVSTNEGTLLTSTELINSTGCDTAPIITFEDDEVGQTCENGLFTVYERTWTVTNQNSGLSSSCVQTINVKRFSPEEILLPKSFDGLDSESLTCETAGLATGLPMLPFGRALEDCGNFQMTSSDLTFSICGPVASKTIRTFTILDWCTGEIIEHEQVIKIEDVEPIVATCSPDDIDPADAAFLESIGFDLNNAPTMPYMTTTNSSDCTGDWNFVPPLTIDNPCNDDITFTLSYRLADQNDPFNPDPNATYIDDDVVVDANGFPLRIENLPGNQFTWIRIEMEDECGNEGLCFSEVFVRDDVRPTPVCVEFTVVSLGDDGCGFLPAESVDNRSYDNCGVEELAVRRVGDAIFEDRIELCCTDCADGPIMVELLVTDGSGNSNTCSAEVRLQDNIPVTMVSTPPADMTFDCEDSPLDLTSIIDAELANFEFTDNCDVFSFTASVTDDSPTTLERGSCGEGSVIVKYEVIDNCGMLIGTFNQTFSFTNNSLTDPSQFTVTRWPEDLTLTNCTGLNGLDPEGLDSPFNSDNIIVNTSSCNDVAIGFDDLVFFNVDNACLKILRTWTVVDWCIANAPGNTLADATRTHTQDIKIFDTSAPVVTASNITVSDSIGVCSANVELIASVEDVCTDMFPGQENTVTYTIAFADGTTGSGMGLDASGVFPLGTSTVSFVAEDHCGNVADAVTVTVTVIDAKAPTPYCLGSVVTATMSNAGAVEIWADDFDLGGTDTCDDELDIFFVRNGVESTSLSFDCTDIPNGVSNTLALEVHFRDDAGNSDFCLVSLFLQDNNSDVCEPGPDTGSRVIAGNVHNDEHENIENVMVSLLAPASDINTQMMTVADGNYAFDMVDENVNYVISSEKQDHILNGLSTLDILIIQRHILGSTTFTSPYKVIAADVNNDQIITAIDLITLRRIILGSIEELPNGGTPWRFPNESQNFVDVLSPFPYTETIDIFNLQSDMSDQDFVGVKIGDVNGSAIVNSFSGDTEIDKRSNDVLTLAVADQKLQNGEQVTIPVYADNMTDIAGFQNTLSFDASSLTLVEVVAGEINVTDDNVAYYNAENGSIAISWNEIDGVIVDSDAVLFELVFDVTANTSVAQNLFIGSGMTKAEAYTSDLDIMDMELSVRNAIDSEFVLYQNVPNPFSDNTEIQFSLPGAGDVTFTVFDLNGREVLRQTNTYNAGNNTISLSADQLNATSVMYYTLETAYGTASRKMIQIR